MASLDFKAEKSVFRTFYEENNNKLNDARRSFTSLINSLIKSEEAIATSKIEGRIKDKDECINKFDRKYRQKLEDEKTPYKIQDHITDLIGIRIVCLYEDDIKRIHDIIKKNFRIIDITNKSAEIEETEDSFGYKGLHIDITFNEERRILDEYKLYSDMRVELQIRTVIQDAWSILDHKIKYKKSIPNQLRRRINTLSALFELADREFIEIRKATLEQEKGAAKQKYEDILKEYEKAKAAKSVDRHIYTPLDAFNFLPIANHFFPEFEFESTKVDGFVNIITGLYKGISRGKFDFYLRESISHVKKYKKDLEQKQTGVTMNPYTVIRHCLYLSDVERFGALLYDTYRSNFDDWLKDNPN